MSITAMLLQQLAKPNPVIPGATIRRHYCFDIQDDDEQPVVKTTQRGIPLKERIENGNKSRRLIIDAIGGKGKADIFYIMEYMAHRGKPLAKTCTRKYLNHLVSIGVLDRTQNDQSRKMPILYWINEKGLADYVDMDTTKKPQYRTYTAEKYRAATKDVFSARDAANALDILPRTACKTISNLVKSGKLFKHKSVKNKFGRPTQYYRWP